VIQSLGLKCRKANRFDDSTSTSLHEEVARIGRRLYAQLSNDDFAKCASDPNYLAPETDTLLSKFGLEIWGQDADSSRLLDPENLDGEAHSRYGDDEDGKKLRLYLHRWIFVKAFAERRGKDGEMAREQALATLEEVNSQGEAFVVQDRDFVLTQHSRQAHQAV
jgi:hypothetical protein